MPPKLETRDITAVRDGKSIVDGVSLAVAEAEVLAIGGQANPRFFVCSTVSTSPQKGPS